MVYLYDDCDQISDFCHQQLLRKIRRKISWTDGRTDRGKTVYPFPFGEQGYKNVIFVSNYPMTIYIQLGLNQVCIMQFLRIFFNSFSHGISYITLCIVVAEILEFRSVQKKNCKGPRQDHSHNSYKSKTTKQFLNNRTIKLSQSNCIIGSASINAEFHINTKI